MFKYLIVVAVLLSMTLEAEAQRRRSRFSRNGSPSASSPSGSSGKGEKLESPLSQEQMERFAEAKPEDITNANFPETIESFDYPNAEIADVIKAMSELTGKNFIIDPSVRGKITIIAPSQITVAEAWRAFLSALAINGYTVVPSGKFLKIRSARNAQRDSIETYSGDYFPNADQMITRVIHLKHISASAVNKELRLLTSKDGEMSVYDATNSVIISDYGSNIERVMRILDQLDVRGFEEKIEVMRVKHAKASEIAELIDQIVNKDDGGKSKNGRRSRFRRRNSSGSAGSGGDDTGLGNMVSFNVIPDERTNSLIVVGNKGGIARIRKLLSQLDFRLRPEDAGGVYVYYVKHGDAEEISKTLTGIAKQTGASGGNSGGGSARGGSSRNNTRNNAPDPTEEVFGGDIKITADKTTNSLIVTASRQDYEVVLSLLQKIDIARDQVYVEAIIIETNLSDTASYGVGYYKFDGASKGIGRVGFNGFENLTSVLNPLGGSGTILGFGSGDEIEIDLGNGQTQTISDTVGFINFLKGNTRSNVLSTPTITALDNEEAEIEVGDRIPVGNTTAVAQSGVATTAPTFEDATIKLKIKPFISPSSESIRMEIDQQVKQLAERQVTAADLANSAVSTTNRTIKTKIVVNNGDTAVLGGLIKDEISEQERKVPFLGDIPLIGWLFKSTRSSVNKVNLSVFITPRILRTSKDRGKLLGRKVEERIDFIKKSGGVEPFGDTLDKLSRKALPTDETPVVEPVEANAGDSIEYDLEESDYTEGDDDLFDDMDDEDFSDDEEEY